MHESWYRNQKVYVNDSQINDNSDSLQMNRPCSIITWTHAITWKVWKNLISSLNFEWWKIDNEIFYLIKLSY